MDQRGVEPIISGILYLVISIAVVAIVLELGTPYLEKVQDVATIDKAKILMKSLDKVISNVASEGTGSSRYANIELRDVTLQIDKNMELIWIEKETAAKIIKDRYRVDQGHFFISSNADVKAYEGEYGGSDVYILENEHIYIAIAKIDSNTSTSLSQLVKTFRYKDTNSTYAGTVDFYLDNYSTADNNVSTSLAKLGYMLGQGEVVADVHHADYSYDLHFILESGADFVRVYIDNLVWSS